MYKSKAIRLSLSLSLSLISFSYKYSYMYLSLLSLPLRNCSNGTTGWPRKEHASLMPTEHFAATLSIPSMLPEMPELHIIVNKCYIPQVCLFLRIRTVQASRKQLLNHISLQSISCRPITGLA